MFCKNEELNREVYLPFLSSKNISIEKSYLHLTDAKHLTTYKIHNVSQCTLTNFEKYK